jgi:TRAP-type C4-dicarboxylate transport system substrate-binding protein
MYVTPMAVVMNKAKYNSLPDFAKKAIDQASGRQWGLHAANVYDNHDRNTLNEINKRGKIQVYKLPDSEKQKIENKVKALQADWIAAATKKGISAEEMLADVQTSARKNK